MNELYKLQNDIIPPFTPIYFTETKKISILFVKRATT